MEAGSYDNIALSLGTDAPADILFATDNEHEAEAAIAAGWQVPVADLQRAASAVVARTWSGRGLQLSSHILMAPGPGNQLQTCEATVYRWR